MTAGESEEPAAFEAIQRRTVVEALLEPRPGNRPAARKEVTP